MSRRSTWGSVLGLVERREQRIDGAEAVAAEQLRRVDLGEVGRAARTRCSARRMPASWRTALRRSSTVIVGQHRLSTLPGTRRSDEPVGAELAAVGDDLGVADLGGQQRPERRPRAAAAGWAGG